MVKKKRIALDKETNRLGKENKYLTNRCYYAGNLNHIIIVLSVVPATEFIYFNFLQKQDMHIIDISKFDPNLTQNASVQIPLLRTTLFSRRKLTSYSSSRLATGKRMTRESDYECVNHSGGYYTRVGAIIWDN